MIKPVKIAILSLTHGHARKYFQVLRDNPNLEWLAASAETPEIKNQFEQKQFGVPCYPDEKTLFDAHPDLEAVVIASANDKHLSQIQECSRRGLHVLCMKVPTFDMNEYDQMIESITRAGIVCQVELELHYNPVVRRTEELINAGKIGSLLSVQATNLTLCPAWAFPWQKSPEQSYGRRQPLKPGDSRFCGGALADHPHIFDWIRWVTRSEYDSIYAQVAPNLRTDMEVEDLMVVSGKMKNGIHFLIDPSWSRMEERIPEPGPGWEVFPKRMEVNITASGDQGMLLADCFGPNIYHNGAPNDRYTIQYTYFDEWIGLVDEFVDCIRNDKKPKINLEWHQKTIEAMNACYKSVYQGQPVFL